jgi:hypothetical protein
MYAIERFDDGWKIVKSGETICVIPTESEALTVARILQADHESLEHSAIR